MTIAAALAHSNQMAGRLFETSIVFDHRVSHLSRKNAAVQQYISTVNTLEKMVPPFVNQTLCPAKASAGGAIAQVFDLKSIIGRDVSSCMLDVQAAPHRSRWQSRRMQTIRLRAAAHRSRSKSDVPSPSRKAGA